MSSRSPTTPHPSPASDKKERVEPWASIDEAAAHLGVRKDSVYRWIESRGLPARKIGKLWKLKLSEVDAWVNASGANEDDATPPVTARVRRPAPRDHVVMVIDDEALVRDTLGDFLTDEGYRVLLANNGSHALKLLSGATLKPSLILLDLKMPDVDGWQFRELQLRDENMKSIPVIVLTGTPNAEVKDAAAVLRKPLRLPVIAKAIKTVLEAELEEASR